MRLIVEVHEGRPKDFFANVEVVACYLEQDDKLLLLQSSNDKSEKARWGVPAGKLEKGETPLEGAIRELKEETGIEVQENQIYYLGALYIRKPDVDYVYHLFQVQVEKLPKIQLSAEHQNYAWASFEDLENWPLMAGAKQALYFYQKQKK